MRVFSAISLVIMAIVWISLPVFAADAPAQDTSTPTTGWVNWDRQVMKAVGHGVLPGDADNPAQASLMARSAAIADAYRNLASVVNGVRVTGDTYVKNYITESDEVRLKVKGFIRGAQIVSEKQLSDRSYEIILQLPMNGKNGLISDLDLLPENSRPVATGEGPTGLIIDARGLDVKPGISPKIYDENCAEVYGTIGVSPDYAIEVGIAAYPKNMELAMKSTRVGRKPLVVKALRKSTKSVTDIVISNDNAARIRDANSKTGMLDRCSVAIVLGPTVPAH